MLMPIHSYASHFVKQSHSMVSCTMNIKVFISKFVC